MAQIKNFKVGIENDGRRKLTEEDKQRIKYLYHKEGYSINAIGREGFCSKRMVQFILFPERYEENKKRRMENWKRYYNTKKKKKEMRKYRKKIKKLYKSKYGNKYRKNQIS